MVGCYSDFNDPEVAYVYTDADFDESQIVSIYELKQQYSAFFCESQTITEDIVIRGKVISNDKDGNVYKSLYILDHADEGSAAIELRLYSGTYLKYPVGTMVYVGLKGLSIADFRGMLSIGYPTSTPLMSSYPDYLHTYIDTRVALNDHIFKGETFEMESRDTLVVNSTNYTSLTNDDLARLVRFEGVESVFGASKWGYSNTYPNYFNSTEDQFEWSEEIAAENPALDPAPLAYVNSNVYYYGSSWYTYNESGTDNTQGQYVIRASAYSNFYEQAIPADGSKVNITAIYTRYTNSSNYEPNTAYQVVPNSGSDIEIVE